MNRSDFLLTTGLFAGLGFLPTSAHPPAGDIAPLLLPPLPALPHNGSMNLRTRVRSEMTGGVYSCVETAVAPKTMGPPPHSHDELDELMFVLEGTASVLVGTEVVQVDAGGWHLRPRKIQHTFWNATDAPLLFIDMYFNQPFERYLEKIFFELTPENGYVEGSEAKNRIMADLNREYGLRFSDTAFAEFDRIKATYGVK